jgi:crotonobetainyl-CoA:carnitine CoA-transferase CaiB-like acyl-CoA transferase
VEPFAGLRVLDLSRTRVGAQASQLLADFGAEVVLVEPPGGGELRRQAAFPFWARGKKSLALDIHAPKDRETILRLAEGADVVLEDLGDGAADALGLGYDRLRRDNPGLVHCAISGFGSQGPYVDAPADDGLVMAKLGFFQAFGRIAPQPDRPAFVTTPFAAYAASQVALHGILAALHERETSGLGQKVEASLALSVLGLDTWAWIEHVLAARWPDALKPYSNYDDLGRPRSHLTFRLLVALTSDGVWLQFAATAPKLFAAKMRALGLDWMFDDPDWAGLPSFEDAHRRAPEVQRRLGPDLRPGQ